MKDLILIYGHNRLKEVAQKFRDEIAKAPKEELKHAPLVQLRAPHLFDQPDNRVIAVCILDATDEQREKISETYRRRGARVIDENLKTLAEPYPPDDTTNKDKELPQQPTGDGSEHQLPNDPEPPQAASQLPPQEEQPTPTTTDSGDPVDPAVLRKREREAAKGSGKKTGKK